MLLNGGIDMSIQIQEKQVQSHLDLGIFRHSSGSGSGWWGLSGNGPLLGTFRGWVQVRTLTQENPSWLCSESARRWAFSRRSWGLWFRLVWLMPMLLHCNDVSGKWGAQLGRPKHAQPAPGGPSSVQINEVPRQWWIFCSWSSAPVTTGLLGRPFSPYYWECWDVFQFRMLEKTVLLGVLVGLPRSIPW